MVQLHYKKTNTFSSGIYIYSMKSCRRKSSQAWNMLTIQFGQCGNQLGHALFSKISADTNATNTGVTYDVNYQYTEHTFDKWFKGISKSGKRLARAILVDTEQKVVNDVCTDSTATWTYCLQDLVCQAGGGSANNWAFGYSIKGKQLEDIVLETTRRELERMDHCEGILMLLSSAGGTGSGVGSCTSELLRDEFPTKTIASVIVLPYTSGEVGTQNYNTLLTVAKFCDQTDIVLLFENEQIHAICTNLLKNFNTKLQDLNEVISQKLAAIFQPVNDTRRNMISLVSQVTSHPSYKLATVKSIPHVAPLSTMYETSYKWQQYNRHLKQTLRIPNYDSVLTDMETKMPSHSLKTEPPYTYCHSVSNVLITRGTSVRNDAILCDELYDKKLYVDWVPETDQFSHLHQTRHFLNRDKFLALVTNNSQLHRPMDTVLNKAWNMYTHAAFLHQYKQYGLEEDDFLQTFAKIENVVKVYKELDIQ